MREFQIPSLGIFQSCHFAIKEILPHNAEDLNVFVCVQYFSPYVSADMTKMAQAFNTTVAALEDELTQLILEGLINARIDSHSKVKTKAHMFAV